MSYYDIATEALQATVPWSKLEQLLPWQQDMAECIQDPVFHAEGDVWTHTVMVVEALLSEERFKALSETRQRILFWAAVLHDIAKPRTREEYFDDHLGRVRVSHKMHSRFGEQMSRPFLWKLQAPMAEREEICSLIRYHQRIFHLLNDKKSLKYAIEISHRCKAHDLYLHAVADHRGRKNLTEEDTELQLDLTYAFFQEHNIEDKPWSFANGSSLYAYFAKSDRNPYYSEYENEDKFDVVMLSGLPGSGKDYLVQNFYADYPVVSLDDIRQEIGAAPTGNQGKVINKAFDLAKKYLRKKQRFVWNATNLSKDLRSKPLRLFKDYNANTKIHYLEVSRERLLQQNKSRDRVVSEKVIEQMLSKWQPADPWEADEVIWQFEDDVLETPAFGSLN